MTDAWLTNAGDAAIALSTHRLISDLAPGAAILHAAYGAEAVGERYPELDFAPPLEVLTGTRWTGPGQHVELVASADLILSQGGGFLREEYEPWSRLDALARATATGVPLLLLGQTIGRFDLAHGRRTFAEVLRRAAGTVVRDLPSLRHVLDLGADPERVRLGADLALALQRDRARLAAPAAPGGDPVVAVVLSDYVVGGPETDRRRQAIELLSAVAAALPEWRVEAWSSAQGVDREHDEDVVLAAVEQLDATDRGRVTAVTTHVDAHELMARTADAKAVVSMRLHPALLAAVHGTPALLVLEDQKAEMLRGTPLSAMSASTSDREELIARLRELPGHPPPELGDLEARLELTISELRTALRIAASRSGRSG